MIIIPALIEFMIITWLSSIGTHSRNFASSFWVNYSEQWGHVVSILKPWSVQPMVQCWGREREFCLARFWEYDLKPPTYHWMINCIGWSIGFLYSNQLFSVDEQRIHCNNCIRSHQNLASWFWGINSFFFLRSLPPTPPPWSYTSQGPYGVWPLRPWTMVPCGQAKLAGRKAGDKDHNGIISWREICFFRVFA